VEGGEEDGGTQMNDKHLAVITPLILLVIMVAFTQTQIVPIWLSTHRSTLESALPEASGLQLVGYNFNRDLVQVSVTLWNRGTNPLNITSVYFDKLKLIKGTVGSPTDPTITGTNPEGNLTVTANDIVFPAAYHWNMYTAAGNQPIIQPNGFVTFYLGISSPLPGSVHTLIVLAGTQQFVFELQKQATI
jgi:hypothetical protein